MSEYFLRLDPNNSNNEFDYLLGHRIFDLADFEEFYKNGRISKREWERVKDYYDND